jgi:hypothetical protein
MQRLMSLLRTLVRGNSGMQVALHGIARTICVEMKNFDHDREIASTKAYELC